MKTKLVLSGICFIVFLKTPFLREYEFCYQNISIVESLTVMKFGSNVE